MLVTLLNLLKETQFLSIVLKNVEVMVVHDHDFVLFVPIHIADVEAFDFKTEGLTFLEIDAIPAELLYRSPLFSRFAGSASRDAAAEDFKSDVLRKVADLYHHIVNAFVLSEGSKRGLLLGEADHASIEADVIADLCDAPQN